MKKLIVNSLIAIALAGIVNVRQSSAQTDNEFYKGKTISILVAFGPGTNYDIYARAMARYMVNHIPGKPNMIVQSMPGAAGIVMANHMYNAAPKDGTVIGLPQPINLFEPLYGNNEAKFDVMKFSWIGSLSGDLVPLCMTWHSSPTKTLEEAKKRETVIAATAVSSISYFNPLILNALTGTKYKPIVGYADSGVIGLAMERGEVEGYCGHTYSTLTTSRPDLLTKNLVNIQVQMVMQRDPRLPNVPSLTDVGLSDDMRQMAQLVFGYSQINRPVFAPGGVPADRLKILRDAFLATVKDPGYLEEANKLSLDTITSDSSTVEAVLKRLYATPKPVIDRIAAIRDGK